jgi:hypothetical protein
MSRPPGKPVARRKPGPSAPDLFVLEGGRYRLRLELIQTRGAFPALDLQRIKVADAEKVLKHPDVVDWAATNGLITNPAFVDLVDSCLSRSPCLCCCRVGNLADARRANELIKTMTRFFSRDQYLSSNGIYRTIERLLRDVTEQELQRLKEYSHTLYEQPETIQILNFQTGICAMAPPCCPGVLWVYSTTEGRRFLRHVARQCRKEGIITQVYLATQRPTPVPRLSYRLYAAEVPAGNAAALWAAAKAAIPHMKKGPQSHKAEPQAASAITELPTHMGPRRRARLRPCPIPSGE